MRGAVTTVAARGRGAAPGGALLGASGGGARACAVVDGDQLRAMSAALVALRARRRGVALHVLAREAGPPPQGGGAPEVRCGLAAALAVAEACGAPLLAPASVQDAHDCAVAAHAEAARARVPVLHAVDPEAEGACGRGALLRYGALAGALEGGAGADAALPSEASLAAALSRAGAAPVRYHGHAAAEAVLLVAGGAAGAAARAACALAHAGVRVGVAHLLLMRPFPAAALAAALPASVAQLGSLGAACGALLGAAAAALAPRCAGAAPLPLPLLPAHAGAPLTTPAAAFYLRALAGGAAGGSAPPPPLLRGAAPRHPALSLWALSGDAGGAAEDAEAARGLLRALAASEGANEAGGPWAGALTAGSVGALGVATRALLRRGGASDCSEGVDLAVVGHPALLGAFSVCAPLREGGALLVRLPPPPAGAREGGGSAHARALAALEAHLPADARAQLARGGRRVFALPPAGELALSAVPGADAAALQVAALHALGGGAPARVGARLLEEQARGGARGASLAALLRLHARVRGALTPLALPASWRGAEGVGAAGAEEADAEAREAAAAEAAAAGPAPPPLPLSPLRTLLGPVAPRAAPAPSAPPSAASPGPVDFAPPAPPAEPPPSARAPPPPPDVRYARATQKTAALSLAFPAAYHLAASPRPHAAGTVEARVQAFQRLTPPDYDRNIFHIEFDVAGTGLTYGIGAALGVHGRNDAGEVAEFLRWYGVAPGALVSAPVEEGGGGGHGAGGEGGGRPGRVALQPAAAFFEQEADVFGRATREFYEGLSRWAAEGGEAAALRALGGDAGEAAFAAREAEGATFADALRDFPSARPPLEELVALLPRIKPRHYSIASSQRAHPTSVHLLVVEVEWTTPRGRRCFGQCSHYLAGLRPGAPVTVSVITSEMHLPADPTAPVLMAGLGTGMAPFRAFIQERACRRAAGEAVGPMTLYFGARHRAQEYLYGTELEAAAAQGLLTLRLAFSRDTAKKVYIQHLMMEDGAALCAALNPPPGAPQGAFYLCGPTWPEPDVEEAVTRAFVDAGGLAREAAAKRITALKAAKSYVLEVY